MVSKLVELMAFRLSNKTITQINAALLSIVSWMTQRKRLKNVEVLIKLTIFSLKKVVSFQLIDFYAAIDTATCIHDDVIRWKHFPCYWSFVRGIHRSPVNSPHKGHWRGALMLSLICAWINGWVSNRGAGDLRRHRAHYDVTVVAFKCNYHKMQCFRLNNCATKSHI